MVAAVTYDVDVVVSVTTLLEVQPEKRKRPFRSAAAEDCTSSSSEPSVLESELLGRQTSIQYSVYYGDIFPFQMLLSAVLGRALKNQGIFIIAVALMGEYWGCQISYLDGAMSARLTSSRGASSMLLFFFPLHAGTCDNAVVATVSVIATWKHVGVVVDVTAVAAVLERVIICNHAFAYA